MIKLAISGCLGRMGKRISALASKDQDFKIHALLESAEHPQSQERVGNFPISTHPEAMIGSGVLIEFTTPEATLKHLEFCQKNQINMVIGTTGLTPAQNKIILKATKKIAVVYSSNLSVGVNIFFKITKELAEKTPETYAVHIREAHHIHKKDAPSGTAKTLARIIEENSKRRVDNIESIREGEIIGDHRVTFMGPDDTITIEHHAQTRDIFAKGALVAAKFVSKKRTGLFSMQDVLGL
jgi:4-hydroxy-tetrahydrodipicolinate reductase